jgi:hypothetical protein
MVIGAEGSRAAAPDLGPIYSPNPGAMAELAQSPGARVLGPGSCPPNATSCSPRTPPPASSSRAATRTYHVYWFPIPAITPCNTCPSCREHLRDARERLADLDGRLERTEKFADETDEQLQALLATRRYQLAVSALAPFDRLRARRR